MSDEKNKTPEQDAISLDLNGTRLDVPERPKSERVELMSIFLKHLDSN